MARTPLFSRFRTLLRQAAAGDFPAPARRRFLHAGAAAGALAVAACASAPDRNAPTRVQPRIGIVGAGLAGLNCAWQLRKQNLRATVFEAATRAGGRVRSQTGLLGPALTTELGGEFIDSGHEDVLALCKEFGLPLLDMRDDHGVIENAWYFSGRHVSDTEVVQALKPFARRIESDAELAGLEPDAARQNADFAALDATSLSDYLQAIGCTGWLRALIEVAFVTEYGLDAADQSCLNMLCLLAPSGSPFEPFGESDERYKVRGGNERLCEELARRLEGTIRLEHRLARVSGPKPFRLVFDTPRGAVEEAFDVVVLALPFTILRELELRVELPPAKRRAIVELGYGRNGKLIVGTDRRPWRVTGYSGGIFSDEPFQLVWDNSRLQWGKGADPVQGPAGLTFYSGGSMCDMMALGTPANQIERLVSRLEPAFPGVQRVLNGKSLRMNWPQERFVLASYAAYRPGQWTAIRGHEGTSVGDLYFAGEHCSLGSQGYMNGAAETGRVAAARIAAALPA
ncbi:MAG: FAD-dependent oxidoreductase [Planctomycetes bacterium]|nr:FAD-dependent oxidoreductase [Planctomycetota bacterium]MCL4730669.1 FAD-dependent oxidoreductase [Planctomycetota bacterium]